MRFERAQNIFLVSHIWLAYEPRHPTRAHVVLVEHASEEKKELTNGESRGAARSQLDGGAFRGEFSSRSGQMLIRAVLRVVGGAFWGDEERSYEVVVGGMFTDCERASGKRLRDVDRRVKPGTI
jgi:hypothetical protein